MTEYKMTTYLEEANRTTAEPEELYAGEDEHRYIATCLGQIVFNAADTDANKRLTFYGADFEKTVKREAKERQRIIKELQLPITLYKTGDFSVTDMNLIHVVYGVVTEAAEIAEEILKAGIEKRELNKTNLKEELGDLLWYIALGINTLGLDFEGVAKANIDKLKVRYPEKFTTEKAMNRDLEAEENALKG
jgi:NTP pyrophosphatase (non-canonical NTP hydrolase)